MVCRGSIEGHRGREMSRGAKRREKHTQVRSGVVNSEAWLIGKERHVGKAAVEQETHAEIFTCY